jgi:serine/threonine protein kinase
MSLPEPIETPSAENVRPKEGFVLYPGDVVANRYEVVRCLGAGSMGLVYLCKHLDLTGMEVALKVLSPAQVASAGDDAFAARFLNEIAATYRVSHTNVVCTYDFIRENNGFTAYTMEYVAGSNLQVILRSGYRFSMHDTVRILYQMCAGVDAIHSAGIVHRDLKPANILISELGEIKITDFGIARTKDGRKLTARGGVVGTIKYVSPEYLADGTVEKTGDIYSIGTIAYELITGEVPFTGSNMFETVERKLHQSAVAPLVRNPECPAELSSIVERALRRDPQERFQTVMEMIAALIAYDPSLAEYSARDLLRVPRITVPKEVLKKAAAEAMAIMHGGSPEVSPEVAPIKLITALSAENSESEDLPLPAAAVLAAHKPRISSVMVARISLIFVAAVFGGLLCGAWLVQRTEAPQLALLDNTTPEAIEQNVLAQTESALLQPATVSGAGESGDESLDESLGIGKQSQLKFTLAARFEDNFNRFPLLPLIEGERKLALPVTEMVRVVPVMLEYQTQPIQVIERDNTLAPQVISPPIQLPQRTLPAEEIVVAAAPLPGITPRTDLVPTMEYKVRATLLYRFADYITWPSAVFSESAPELRVCLIGAEPFGTFIDENIQRARISQNKPLSLKRVSPDAPLQSIKSCQILFVPASEDQGIVRLLRDSPVLTVTDGTGLGIIDFVIRGGRVKFKISTSRASYAGIEIGPLLLDLSNAS